MIKNDWIGEQAPKSLARILPRIEDTLRFRIEASPAQWKKFTERIQRHWEWLFTCLYRIYGWQYDFFFTLEQVAFILANSWLDRPESLKSLDELREATPDWYLSQEMVGGVLYVDLFTDNLSKLYDHIPYFRKLGLTLLHLMPLFAVPHGDNDGGYAVSDYRSVNPDLGTMEELERLAGVLRQEGISLVLDFVFNHTSDEHIWAKRARAGDARFQAYYHTFPDRLLPDQYQQHLREVFPTVRRGSFTWYDKMQRWVWTTFNNFQWDLDYSNPEVFRAMAEEMLFLANRGIEVLRLDAIAFIWKQLGTSCENLPEVHWIIRAFNAMARIAAPALLFLSEAIVHPDDVVTYVHPQQCQLSYNPLLMSLLWESIATRRVDLLVRCAKYRSHLPDGCSWVNYLRCHDDIGWTFDDADAWHIGINPDGHRRFLNDFYTGRYPGAFARGVPFQFNPDTGDLRISGTLASLAGLEEALEKQDSHLIEMAVRRINLLRSIVLSIGGMPLIYIGDEWGMINDYTYMSDPSKVNDSRWVHRSRKRWEAREDLTDQDTLEWRFFNEMVKLVELRKKLTAFHNGAPRVIDTGTPHLFGYIRQKGDEKILVVNNFSETEQKMTHDRLQACGMQDACADLITNRIVIPGSDLILDPYRFVWLTIPATGKT